MMHTPERRPALRSRLRRKLSAWFPQPPEVRALMLESFIPYGHLYGIDFGNIDPGLHRQR
ncbi:FIG00553315: hypothetical protein [Cronobacter condimenti 1330]|uniref:Uncharacterized protein n=1 Tax=Cronobacter condimenti 1330 TaxID=1073999 RepID=K7ZZ83_9ENTR|nr:hypothetical protein [Cronobacter condimenti]ALB62709.1 hypothetical protein AFK62_09435 [Cronobacter condimenti 1330]CCJ71525.1 FIG00553315: hypothetical protein [Cronobacter condimenti 1330]